MKKTLTSSVVGLGLLLMVGCSAPNTHERRGTEAGAVAGAIIGGIIGHQSGETAAGAAIGAAVGGTAGAAMGAAKDREEDRRYERGTVRAQPVQDQYGYTLQDYMQLMTDEEMEILQARADARPEVPMGQLLTDREKANLRRREVADKEIGS
ncbi:glycine zipper domain-containing protein [Actomonas aquatica]|uniref:Glycine zipper domain-containing protein n=1 Tax=Actomonas aquatica TaxID=2866162 RepID=A0ABZ1CBE3_9BACT|nr:glycine zipper domain-containing protein [Opitutus sp. WL0086]WRQ89007.1 glycine zipper domain-containing protein [Opitutus sp. WL0086]